MAARPRSDEKISKILEATRTCLGRGGYQATTVSEIAAEAGISRGLLHYYFANKEDLLVQLVRTNIERTLELVSQLFGESSTAEELASGLTEALRAKVRDDPTLFSLAFECWAVIRQSTTVEAEVRDMFRRFRNAIFDQLADAARRDVVSSRIPADGLAVLLSGLFHGLALQIAVDPGIAEDDELWRTFEASLLLLLLFLKEGS